MKEIDFKTLNFTLLGKESNFDGELSLSGDVIIAGGFKGQLNIKDSGKLTLERDAQVEGTIQCDDIEIFGSFSGTIQSSGTVSVRSSAIVSGRLKGQKLSIYPGARLNIEGDTE